MKGEFVVELGFSLGKLWNALRNYWTNEYKEMTIQWNILDNYIEPIAILIKLSDINKYKDVDNIHFMQICKHY